MKFLHLSDLHFGKTIHGVSLIESGDQPYWAERFLEKARCIRPDAVVIAGDVYDRSVPPGDAMELLDHMITRLTEWGIPVLMVAGNHDSGQRLAFASGLLEKQNVYIAGTFAGELPHVTLTDLDGPVTFWLMPYIFPALVAQKTGMEDIRDYDTAVRRLLAQQDIDFSQRNVLVAHQNVTANGREAVRGGSESMAGGVGQVDYSAFDGFDYVALGHIHAAYPVGRKTVRYAGSPLCYHFDEIKQPAKGPVLVELGAKGTEPGIEIQTIPPLHPMREMRGDYAALRAAALEDSARGEYIRVVLTDRRPEPEIHEFFRALFDARESCLMELVSEYRPFGTAAACPAARAEQRAVEELFADFYRARRDGIEPDEREQALFRFVGDQVRRMHPEEAQEKQAAALLKFALGQEEEA